LEVGVASSQRGHAAKKIGLPVEHPEKHPTVEATGEGSKCHDCSRTHPWIGINQECHDRLPYTGGECGPLGCLDYINNPVLGSKRRLRREDGLSLKSPAEHPQKIRLRTKGDAIYDDRFT